MDQLDLVGHCVNALPWRTQVEADVPFADYMKSSRSSLLDALDHQCYSYGTLLRKLAPPRDPSRAPMLSISFNVDPTIDTSDMGFTGLTADVVVEPRSFENFEWFVNGTTRICSPQKQWSSTLKASKLFLAASLPLQNLQSVRCHLSPLSNVNE